MFGVESGEDTSEEEECRRLSEETQLMCFFPVFATQVWDLDTLECVTTLVAHRGSILALCAIPATSTVYSGSRCVEREREID